MLNYYTLLLESLGDEELLTSDGNGGVPTRAARPDSVQHLRGRGTASHGQPKDTAQREVDHHRGSSRDSDTGAGCVECFTHGGPDNFFMVTVRNDQDGSFLNDIRLYRHIFHNDSFSRAHLRKLKFENFSEDAKVEIHGCQTAANSDNIVADFSKYLFEAGKAKSVVIGHTTKADPRINGDNTEIPEQDYQHLERAIYRGGKLLTKTKKTGALDERELAK